jgi:hypothetical protein
MDHVEAFEINPRMIEEVQVQQFKHLVGNSCVDLSSLRDSQKIINNTRNT